MRVLLTGAAGFIGSHVHRALCGAGHDVVAVDALLRPVHGPDAAAPEGVSVVDIRDPRALEPLLRGVEVVCHLAAAVPPGSLAFGGSMPESATAAMTSVGDAAEDEEAGDVPADDSDSSESAEPTRPVRGRESGREPRANGPSGPDLQDGPVYADHNDVGTAVLLAAMARAGVRRLVLGSSVSVYGEGRYRGARSGPYFPGVRRRADLDRGMFDHRAPRTGEILTWEPVVEDAPPRPRSAYAASKVAQEHYALAWGIGTGAAVTVLRYHHVYGDPAGEHAAPTAHSGVAARFRAELAAGRAPFVFEDGGQVRDFVHVRDAAAATLAAVERPLPGFVPLNIASGHPITLWQAASIMSRARGGPEPVVSGQYRLTDVRHIVAHPERAREALGFTARLAPAQGLAEYAMDRSAAS
ncbi:NAD-dependent epimerase/dehydratase family protein [Nocardia sp. CDC159]|uniref:UDP-glucose 4-epimerase n=1 Tax=Nocardia pulmonis TaxID=2951408 RepID=A0A9X2IXK8_9NOCA|nr:MULTISPECIES: NAD-dependent epimerase/dehydratase family protein [Nocardia]MCM6776122.1 NAD-dependent epimerase/dehydratase family protein [Nocardia pulmonis]MCM6788551.1 NAD-dependent epimerase/dehydratase family protein [Nocardia sp. CDC159]